MMNKKMVMFLMVLVLSCVIWCGCSNGTQETGTKNAEYTEYEHILNVPEGWSSGDIAAGESTLYYVVSKDQFMGNFMLAAQIIAYDVETGEENICYQHDASQGFYLNELEAAGDFLYWVRVENGDTFIESMDTLSGEITVVEEMPGYLNPVLLQTDSAYLTWYEDRDETSSIQGYEIEKRKRIVIAETVKQGFPYTRAIINDGICAFVSEESGKQYINIYDVRKGEVAEKFKIDDDMELFSLQADRERCVYSVLEDGAVNSEIFAYDYDDKKTSMINEGEDTYVFSFHLMDGKVYINERNQNCILIRDADDLSDVVLMDEEDHLYVLGSSTAGGCYIALDCIDPEKPVMLVVADAMED